MRRRLDRLEKALWKMVTRDVQPLARQPIETMETPPAPAPPVPPLPDLLPVVPAVAVPKPLPPLPQGFDSAVERRIRLGKARIEARIDLHGMTQDEAYAALAAFIGRGAASGIRLGLVITGKGPRGEGVLKRNLPRWLDTPPLRSKVSAIRPAFDRDGGEGAFYVSFKRPAKTPTASPR